MPRNWAIVSGFPPAVLSHAVMPVKFGASPQLMRVVAFGLQLASMRFPWVTLPLRALSLDRTPVPPSILFCSALV